MRTVGGGHAWKCVYFKSHKLKCLDMKMKRLTRVRLKWLDLTIGLKNDERTMQPGRKQQRHAAVTSLCASRDKTAQKPDTRNPSNVLYPRAETWLSHGSWCCIYRLSDHTANMKNVEQMEGDVQRVSSDSSSGRKHDNVKQVDVSARGRTSLAADKSI